MRHLPIYLFLALLVVPTAAFILRTIFRYSDTLPKDSLWVLSGISLLSTIAACCIVWLAIFVPCLLIATWRRKRINR